jgi:predicted Zn-dependent peptidase
VRVYQFRHFGRECPAKRETAFVWGGKDTQRQAYGAKAAGENLFPAFAVICTTMNTTERLRRLRTSLEIDEAPPRVLTLHNGLRVIEHTVPTTRLAMVSLTFDCGSRDEPAAYTGIAHLVEHMVFKGTEHRKAHHILSRIDAVGGELNAYTTKEKTCYYAIVAREHLERALELLVDIGFYATFPTDELEKEKTVIAEEIDMYRDNHEEAIQEDLDQLVFPNHPLGASVLGSRESLARIDRDVLLRYYRSWYRPERAVLSVTGNFPDGQVYRLMNKHLLNLPATEMPDTAMVVNRNVPETMPSLHKTEAKALQQAHLMMGARAFPALKEGYLPLLVLNNYLAGPTMNNRLSMVVREKHGLSYNLWSSYSAFLDTGYWLLYAGCDGANVARVKQLVKRELDILCQNPVSDIALQKMVVQFTGSLVLQQEKLTSQNQAFGRDLLDYGRILQLDELLNELEAMTPQRLHEVAQQVLNPEGMVSLAYLPQKD